MNTLELNRLRSALIPVAREAGRLIMDVYGKDNLADVKADGSPVTEADRVAEAIILSALDRLAPSIPIVSEENARSHHRRHSDAFFLVDPLDGTKEFLKRDGKGSFTVNIALVEDGIPVLGIVYAPALSRLFTGLLGIGAEEHNSSGAVLPLAVRKPGTGARVAVASVSHRDPETDAWLVEHGIKNTVSIGSSLKFCVVAAGEADVYPRFGPTMEWDTAAGDAILRAAGGNTTSPEGVAHAYGKHDYRNGAFIAWGGCRP